MKSFRLELPGREPLPLGPRPRVMGILNTTPDSFSDGGDREDPDVAVATGLEMVADGADLLDVGGESTRPGAAPVDPEEELRRVIPVIEGLTRATPVPISIDTRRASVARAALEAGAAIVNDVSGLRDPEMASVVAEAGVPLVLMHMRGTPETMREHAVYDNVTNEVVAELREALDRARAAGIRDVILDPGIGFAKTAAQSFSLLGNLSRLAALDGPILVGPSRKSFLTTIRDVPPKERLHLTIGAVLAAVAAGAHVVRVHDVGPTVDAIGAFLACRRDPDD